MFTLAILIGIYSYIIFALGLLVFLYKLNILFVSLFFFTLILIWKRQELLNLYKYFKTLKSNHFNLLVSFFILLLIVQIFVNFIGALGPELGFDALWYHLTLPKIYLNNHAVIHIPGGLLYYSDMPKLAEMLYTAALSFGNEIWAKLIHFGFGILSSVALYKLSRKFLNRSLSLIVVLIFYSNLVVSWLSITAYVDLARTFFEVMALWGFINFAELRNRTWLIESSVMLGLAITTKLLSFSSLFIFTFLLIYIYLSKKNKSLKDLITNVLVYWYFALIIPLPWFVFSYNHTGNPIYPFFSNIYKVSFDANLLNPIRLITDLWSVFIHSPDPISPLYLIFLPLIIINFKKFPNPLKVVGIYSFIALIVWYFIPRTGGGRFIVPYLPAFSILVGFAIDSLKNKKLLFKYSMFLVILVSLVTVIYRGFANFKYAPVILGKESKDQFLSKNLNFSFGDFYDSDGYFKKNIKSFDKVLLYGFHNLYYIDFPFLDSSWVKKGDTFNYIATQNTTLPSRFSYWSLIYSNPITRVNVYSSGGFKWVY